MGSATINQLIVTDPIIHTKQGWDESRVMGATIWDKTRHFATIAGEIWFFDRN